MSKFVGICFSVKKTFFVIDLFPEKNSINFEWKVAAAEISKIAKLQLLIY